MSKNKQSLEAGYANVRFGVRMLADRIQEVRALGVIIPTQVQGRASATLESIDPLIMQRHGRWLNRGPWLAGRFAVIGMLQTTSPELPPDPHVLLQALPGKEPIGPLYATAAGVATLNGLAQALFDEQPMLFRPLS